MTRNKKTILIVALIAAFPISARLYAWKSAKDFGGYYTGAFMYLGKGSFANTKDLREFLAEPPLTTWSLRAHKLRFLGGGYSARIDELKSAMIYLSEQASLPVDQRTAAPPKLEYFTIDMGDRSDDMVDAAAKVLIDYNTQLSLP